MNIDYQTTENDLLRLAIEAVYRETGLRLLVEDELEKVGQLYGAIIKVEGYKQLRFAVEIKAWLQQAHLGGVINNIQQFPLRGMLVADYVTPKMAEELRKREIPFIDTVGNAYINAEPLFVLVKGNKRTKDYKGNRPRDTRGRAFQPTGLKVLYAFLTNPGLLNKPYRDIANITGVALGTVGWVINDLKQGRYLVEYGRHERRLKNIKKLLDKWVDAYLEKLRPKLYVGTFATDGNYWFLDVDEGIVEYGARWGGETAAAKLTGHLKPEITTIYLPKDGNNKFLAEHRFRKDPNGNIEVYKAFWDIDDFRFELDRFDLTDIVHPLIIYADLLATGDPRNLETARIIYDKELTRLIRED